MLSERKVKNDIEVEKLMASPPPFAYNSTTVNTARKLEQLELEIKIQNQISDKQSYYERDIY